MKCDIRVLVYSCESVCDLIRCQVESVSTEVKQLLHVTSSQDEEDTEEKQPVRPVSQG